jgi:hypothetical protein
VFTNSILKGIDGEAKYEGSDLSFTDLVKYVNSNVTRANREIAARGLKLVDRKKLKSSTEDSAVQTPVATIPDDLSNFLIYRR